LGHNLFIGTTYPSHLCLGNVGLFLGGSWVVFHVTAVHTATS